MSELREYRRLVSVFWWVHKPTYFLFVMRELSSLFVAWFVLYLLLFIAAVARGEEAYRGFVTGASHPAVVALNTVAFAFVVLHTITWFALTPQAMVLRVAGRRVPGWAVIASQYVGLLLVSGLVFWLVAR